jgi:multidrug efflux pump subunit AcrB
MTSLAFGFGVLPLAFGSGSGGQHAVGTGVIGGTSLGLLFGLLCFVLVCGRQGRVAG